MLMGAMDAPAHSWFYFIKPAAGNNLVKQPAAATEKVKLGASTGQEKAPDEDDEDDKST